MGKLKTFKQYVNENHIESGTVESKLSAYLQGKMKTVKEWFQKGMLNNAALADIQVTKSSINLSKDLIVEFNDNQFYYQLIFSVSMNDYQDGKFEKAFLKLKKYSMDIDTEANALKGMLIDEWDSNNPDTGSENGQINTEDFKPEFVLDIISKMEDSTQAAGTEETEPVVDVPKEPQGDQDF